MSWDNDNTYSEKNIFSTHLKRLMLMKFAQLYKELIIAQPSYKQVL